MNEALSSVDAIPDGSLAGDLSLAVVRFARRLRGRRTSGLVSLTQLSALATLYQEGPMSPGALAAAERVQPPSMTRVIASLADLGMVERQPHPSDGRQAIVNVSPDGVEVVAAEFAARKEWLSDRLDELNPADRETLRKAVGIIGTIITGEDNQGPVRAVRQPATHRSGI
ncbi:MarR family winged helix-turn-helix transcriptional regulator [Gordonia sp. CPCC 205333]|uniref:MarR family winged helix-turn-helix transcriptional regulator n=1 Tax=Gordonia sp. CPCC 205333 TaxID=3140790 RepID=UPI003AF360E7